MDEVEGQCSYSTGEALEMAAQNRFGAHAKAIPLYNDSPRHLMRICSSESGSFLFYILAFILSPCNATDLSVETIVFTLCYA